MGGEIFGMARMLFYQGGCGHPGGIVPSFDEQPIAIKIAWLNIAEERTMAITTEEEFGVGFLVVLRCGGPCMAITAAEGTNWRCVWMDQEDHLQFGVFPALVLRDWEEGDEATETE